MAVQRGTHPSAEILKAFGLGKLSESSFNAVMDHVDQCEICSKQVAALSGDDFLNRLRQARSQISTPAPANTLTYAARAAKPAAGRTPVANLPPELAANQQYEIQRELGRGGMGVVYLAKNKLMDRLEVLKVVNKALLDHPGAVERFLREIRSAARLSHANVVGAYHALQMGELLAFAMEYVEGQDLGSLVKSQGPLPIQHACYYVQQAAFGLQHAFEKGMVHRDIKPQNLILAREGKKHIVKVLDFGLAKVMREKSDDTGLTGEGKMLGTPDYIAPEQTLDAAKADIRADIYSLGCTLYYLLSGHPPFSASSLGAILVAHQMHDAKPLNLERPEVPEELAAVVRKMMAKSPAKRFQTPLDVVQALNPFVKQGATAKPSPELSSGPVEAKPAVKPAPPVDPPPAPIVAVPKQPPEPVDVWGSLTEGSTASVGSRHSAIVRTPRAATVRERSSRQKWLVGGGIGVGVLLLALLGMWAGGVFGVKTKYGTLIVEVNEANPYVLVDDEKVTVKWQNGGKKAEIRIKAGTHKIEVKKDGFSVDGTELTFKDGDKEIFKARLLPEKREEKAEAPNPEKPPPQPDPKKPDAPRVVDAADDEGFVTIFNGKNLDGWSVDGGPSGQWAVEGNTIVAQSKDSFRTRNYLLTEKDYADFILRFDFKVEDGSHGGVAVRAIEGEKVPLNNNLIFDHPLIKLTNPAMEGQEPTGMTHWLKNAAAYWGPVQILTVATGIWHSMEVIVRADACTATVDGKKLVNLTLDPVPRNNGGFVPGLGRRKGKVGFQINTGILRFRKIEIKELSPAAAAPGPPKRAANAATEENGFVPLFNGKDLTGWKTHPDNPGDWRVDNGILIGRGPTPSLLFTEKNTYTDFRLLVEARINSGGDSGLCFRIPMFDYRKGRVKGRGYEAQINNTAGKGDYPLTGSLLHFPDTLYTDRLVPPSDWFTLEVLAKGDHFIIWLDGKKTVDFLDLQQSYRRGHLALQVLDPSTVVEFRKIEIKELPAAKSEAPPFAKPEAPPAPRVVEDKAFVPLFNGKDLKGWKTHRSQPGNWRVENGILIGSGPSITSHLYTQRGDYRDFHLLLEARINEGGNSGVYLRTPFGPTRPANQPRWLNGYNAKIDRDRLGGFLLDHPTVKLPLRRNRDPSIPAGQWLRLEVIVQGNHIVVKTNGETTAEYTDDKRCFRSGHIALQQHTPQTVAEFRKIEIKELK